MEPMNLTELLKHTTDLFKAADIPSARLDAEVLLAQVMECERQTFIINPDMAVKPAHLKKFKALQKRRLAGEPVAYLTGHKEFYSLDFMVNPSVLIPRPETELLVDLAIYYAKQQDSVLDLGTGSGAIAIAIKYCRSDVTMLASDISEQALQVAKKNCASILGNRTIRFVQGDLFQPVKGRQFNIIVSNPPYVDRNNAPFLQKELAYEPEIALYAKSNGREVIAKIVKQAGNHLAPQGYLLLEIGETMKEFIEDEGACHDFSVSVLHDYAGMPRVAVMAKKN